MFYIEVALRFLGWTALCLLIVYTCWTGYQGDFSWWSMALCVPAVLVLCVASEMRRKRLTITDDD